MPTEKTERQWARRCAWLVVFNALMIVWNVAFAIARLASVWLVLYHVLFALFHAYWLVSAIRGVRFWRREIRHREECREWTAAEIRIHGDGLFKRDVQ